MGPVLMGLAPPVGPTARPVARLVMLPVGLAPRLVTLPAGPAPPGSRAMANQVLATRVPGGQAARVWALGGRALWARKLMLERASR